MDFLFGIILLALIVHVPGSMTITSYPMSGKYFKSEASMSWDEATKQCSANGARLAEIRTTADQTKIVNLKAKEGETVWTSGHANAYQKDYTWASDNSVVNLNYWRQNQPDWQNDVNPAPYCLVVIYSPDDYRGKWDDKSCSTAKHGAICEFAKADQPSLKATSIAFSGRYVKVKTSSAIDWNEAKAQCTALGLNMCTIRSASEQNSIDSLRDPGTSESYWTGGRAEVNSEYFTWEDGNSAVSFPNWLSPAPSCKAGQSGPFCIAITYPQGGWEYRSCKLATSTGVICEQHPVQAQAPSAQAQKATPSTCAKRTSTSVKRTSKARSTKPTTRPPTSGMELRTVSPITDSLATLQQNTPVPVPTIQAMVAEHLDLPPHEISIVTIPPKSGVETTTDFLATWQQEIQQNRRVPVAAAEALFLGCHGFALFSSDEHYPLVNDPLCHLKQKYPPKLTEEKTHPPVEVKPLLEICGDFTPKRTSPPNRESRTDVEPIFAINRLMEFSADDEAMTVDGELLVKWNVTTCEKQSFLLKFGNISSDPPERVYAPRNDEVWLPKYSFVSSSNDMFMKNEISFGEDLLVTAKSNYEYPLVNFITLDFYHARLGLFSTKCEPRLRVFPFDTQTCAFSFAMEYSIENVQFSKPLFYCPLDATYTEWYFVSCSDYVTTIRRNGYDVSYLTYQASISRKPIYYLWNLVLPNCVLFLLQLSTFLLPASEPDRPLFSMTILLALAFGQSNLLKQVPKTTEDILLIDFMFSLVWISSILTVYHLVTCCLLGKRSRYRKFLSENAKCCCKGTRIRLIDLIIFLASATAFLGLVVYFSMYR